MNEAKVTFKKIIAGEYLASTGERINYYTTSEMALENTSNCSGWYITETDGDFSFNRFDTLSDAKRFVIRRHNIMQLTEIVIASADKTLARYYASKVGA